MATLKISDLSVGDWVKASDVAIRVHNIEFQNGEYFVHFSDPDINSEDYLHAPFIKPIPITAKILEKNGFVKIGEYNEWSTENWEDIPFIGISLSRQSMRIKNIGTDIFLENKVVYVHQLQHALRLAGVDKEIVL